MNINRLEEIPHRLIELYNSLAENKARIVNLEYAIDLLKIALTPSDGKWEGPNADARKITEQRAYLDNRQLQEMTQEIQGIEAANDMIDAVIDGLIAERRGYEWQIRLQLVMALRDNQVQANHDKAPPSEMAFDDTADHYADQAIFEKADPNVPF